jgi:hypothetical protein
MRTFLTVTPIAMAAMVAAAAPALAQGTPSAPAAPAVPQVTLPRGTVTVDVKPGGSYSWSLEHLAVVGGGAVAGYVVGHMVFMGHWVPVITGVAGGYLANLWYTSR